MLLLPHFRSKVVNLNRSSIFRISTRFASTDNEHNQWPKHSHPTPYEVLNLNKHSFDKQKLRTHYYKLAKVYHPDISSNKHLEDHKGCVLTSAHKNERFKLLTDAYTLLKDPRKKAAYDQYKIGWGSVGNRIQDDAFTHQRATHTQKSYYNSEAYWSASGWEDYQNLHKNQGNEGAEMNQDNMKVLAAILCFIIGSVTLQGWYALERVEKSVLEQKKVHDACEFDLEMAYSNYGFESSKLSRIRRFLWFRTFGLYRKKEHLDESSKQNENLIREVIGDDQIN